MADDVMVPWPIEDADSAEFWAGARRSELRLQRCDRCHRYQYYPRAVCIQCSCGDLSWVTSPGTGTIYSYTVSRRAAHPAFADRVPYIVALVDLDEGPRMLSNVVDADAESVRIGDRVAVRFVPVDDGVVLPMFALRSSRIPDRPAPQELENR